MGLRSGCGRCVVLVIFGLVATPVAAQVMAPYEAVIAYKQTVTTVVDDQDTRPYDSGELLHETPFVSR